MSASDVKNEAEFIHGYLTANAMALDNISGKNSQNKVVRKEQNLKDNVALVSKIGEYINAFGAETDDEIKVIKDAVKVFNLYKIGGLYKNSMYDQTVQGCKKFIQQCFRLKACYPDIKLTPDDVFTGTCEVNGNPMVYGKLAVKIGTSHASFSRTQTVEEAQGSKVKWTLTIFGLMKNGQEYEAFKGSFETTAVRTADRESAFSKFMRRSLVKAFPDKFAYGYCEPSDADVLNEKTNEQQSSTWDKYDNSEQPAEIKEAEQIDSQADTVEQPQPAQTEAVADKPVEETWLSKQYKYIDDHADRDVAFWEKMLERCEALPANPDRFSEDDREKVIDKLRAQIIAASERENKGVEKKEKD